MTQEPRIRWPLDVNPVDLTESLGPDVRNATRPSESVHLKFARLRPLDAHLLSATSKPFHVRKAFRP